MFHVMTNSLEILGIFLFHKAREYIYSSLKFSAIPENGGI